MENFPVIENFHRVSLWVRPGSYPTLDHEVYYHFFLGGYSGKIYPVYYFLSLRGLFQFIGH